ncbi:MAG: hypothetical protein KJI72_04255 [Patescibacteria group bacterium]|nr:hypothetical protein [Patescibacteria group bacterium]MCP6727541.1 hypothetical protein [Patescibacteria group bacterium]
MTQNKIDKSVVMTGILSITAMEMFALYQGVNGLLLTTVIGIVALAIGVQLPQIKLK